MKKRLIGTVLCAAVVVGALSGCGSKNTADDNEKKTIRITYSAGELDGESKDLNVIFADFYKDHPNCEVVLEEGGSALMAKIAANDAPDIIRTNSILDLPTYVNKNIIMPLDDMLKKSDLYDEKDIFPVCIDCFKYDGKDFGKGKIYGLPKDWGPSSMWVNKSMLDAKGLRIPTYDSPITFDELADYAKKLTVKEGNKVKVFGYSNIEAPNVTVETMLNLVGKSMYSDDFSKINLKDEDVRKAFKYVYDMKVNGYTQSPLYPMGGNGNSEFPQGLCAINNFGLYSGSTYVKNPDRTVEYDDMILCPTPVMEEGQGAKYTAGPVGATISANTKDPELAFACWEFIHLGIPAQKRANAGFNLPIKKSLAENADIKNEFQKRNFDTTVKYAESGEYTFVRSNPYVAANAVESIMEKYFTPLLYGQYTFDETMKLMENEIQLLIDEGMAH